MFTNVHRSSCKVKVIIVIFQYNWYLLKNFSKNSQNKFHENPSIVREVVQCGRTDRQMDRHDDAKSRFYQFCSQSYNWVENLHKG